LAILSAGGLVAFTVRELTIADPIVDLRVGTSSTMRGTPSKRPASERR